MKEKYLYKLLSLAKKAARKKEVPVSAIIVKNDKIISSAYNKRKIKKDVINHAEIICIKKASKKLKDWRLNECELYVSLKPCNMCMEVIKQSRIKKVYYILDKPINKKEYYRTSIEETNICTLKNEYSQVLREFFQNKRDKSKYI